MESIITLNIFLVGFLTKLCLFITLTNIYHTTLINGLYCQPSMFHFSLPPSGKQFVGMQMDMHMADAKRTQS